MKVLENLHSALAMTLMLMNLLGGIVAGIWLAILGEWGSIGYGLTFGISGAFVIGLAMMPGMLLIGPAVMHNERGYRFGYYIFGFLSTLYQVAVLSSWCMFILFFFAKRADASSVIPLLMWSYGAATGPIAYLAQKDLQSGNEYAIISAIFSQIGFLLVAIVILLTKPSSVTVFALFGAVMLVNMFAIPRHLRGRGVEADVLLFDQEQAHFHPSNDTFDLGYQKIIKKLSWGNPFRFRSVSPKETEASLHGYGFLMGCGSAPAFLNKIGRPLDIFLPYGTDIVEYPFPAFYRNPIHLIQYLSFARSQKEGIERSKLVHLMYTNPEWHGKFLGKIRLPEIVNGTMPALYDPIYAPDVIARHYQQSHWYEEMRAIRDSFDFVVFHPCNHRWINTPHYYNKGNDILVRGFAEFLSRKPKRKSCLVMLEYGDSVQATKRLVAQLGIEDHVRWFPMMPRKEIMIAYSLFDLGAAEFVQSALTYGVVLEGLASGKPLMFHREDALYKDYGELYPMLPARSLETVAKQLGFACDNADALKEMGAQGRQWYLEHIVGRSMNLYLSRINGHRPRTEQVFQRTAASVAGRA